MTKELRDSAQRVQDFITAKGFSFEVKELPGSTRTAQEAADSIGCRVAQIAKSLVFKEKTTHEPILVIASGINRVDVAKIKTATGLKLGKADGNYVKEKVGFAIGGIPPAGHKDALKTNPMNWNRSPRAGGWTCASIHKAMLVDIICGVDNSGRCCRNQIVSP